MARLPTIYLPHGGGPWPFVDLGLDRQEVDRLAAYLRGVKAIPPTPPRALLVISAHWEASLPTVSTHTAPPMIYDYTGFPPAAYTLSWPAPGDPLLAQQVRGLLDEAGFASAADDQRGFDHGTFIPMMLAYPQADVPTVQLSLKKGLDPAEHLAIGRALRPLREEGVFLLGSGMSYHNLRAFWDRSPRAAAEADAFDAWLQQAATAPPSAREQHLSRWSEAPAARQVHPREEHLLPLMVIAGAAGDDLGHIPFSGTMAGKRISAVQYG